MEDLAEKNKDIQNENQISKIKHPKLKNFIENTITTNFILAVIIYNSIALGLLTYPQICAKYENLLHYTCEACVVVFTIEIIIKIIVYKKEFFKDSWNNFDFILVVMSLIPTGGVFSSFRAFRILRALRALRLVTRLEKLRIIVQAIIESIPNIGWVSLLLLLIFYIFAIMGTTMFSLDFPEFFGTIGKSMYSLFQIMTLESWSMGIARPVIKVYPYAWIYFVSFILTSSFIVMNVIVGVVVTAIAELSENAKKEKQLEKLIKNCENKTQKQELSNLELELNKLKEQIGIVENLIKAQKK